MEIYVLPDSTRIKIRPIRADDGDRLRAFHARLSPESRYRRYLGPKPQLSDSDARYLVDVDGFDHFALVATLAEGHRATPGPEADPEPILAVARYIRFADRPGTAEFAIIVTDRHHGQGLATELTARLAEAAVARGVRRFSATMLSDNAAIFRVLERVGAGPLSLARSGPVTEVEVDLVAERDRVAARGRTGSASPAIIGMCAGS